MQHYIELDRFTSPGKGISSAGSRIISLETIDQTETGRRWLALFTFLRLQVIQYIYKRLTGLQSNNKIKLHRNLPRCDVWIWRPPFAIMFRHIVSEKSVMGPRCQSSGTFCYVLRGVFSIEIRIFANVMFLIWLYRFWIMVIIRGVLVIWTRFRFLIILQHLSFVLAAILKCWL